MKSALLGAVTAALLAVPPPGPAGLEAGGPDGAATGLSFGVFADPQYCDCDTKGTRHYRASLKKLATAAQTFNSYDVAFTIHVGDLIDRRYESFGPILSAYDDVNGPRHHVLGNHDFPVSREQVVARLGMPGEYFWFRTAGWRFVVLDTNDISLYANPEGSFQHERAEQILAQLTEDGAVNARAFNGAVGRKQLNWLTTVLEKAAQADEPVVVFGHMPIHALTAHTAWNFREIRRTIESAGPVVAYVNGHNHAGGYAVRNGIHYLTLEGMVEGTSNAYAVVHVEAGRVRVDGFGREPDRLLPLPD